MARTWHMLFVSFVLFASLQIGESLKCYDCMAKPGKECDDPSKNSNFVTTCLENQTACYFRNTTLLEGEGQIIRRCGQPLDCQTPKGPQDVKTTCIVCQTDLCNSSSYVTPSMFVVSIVGVIMAKIYL